MFLFFVSIAYISNLVPIGVFCQLVAYIRQIDSYLFLKREGREVGKNLFNVQFSWCLQFINAQI